MPTTLRSQLVDTLVNADVAHSYAHVLKLLPRSAGLAAALALGRYPVAVPGILQGLPAWQSCFIALIQDSTASFPHARHRTGIGLSYASRAPERTDSTPDGAIVQELGWTSQRNMNVMQPIAISGSKAPLFDAPYP